MPVFINIETKELDRYKKDLRKISRSAYPIAVRNTLNNAGIEMKKNQLHKSAKERFKYTRSKNFFKAFSYAEKAKGFDTTIMKTKVVMRDRGRRSAKEAVKNMYMHEESGSIDKGFMYLKGSRVSSNFGRLVRKKDYFSKDKVSNVKSNNFVYKAIKARNEGKTFLHRTNKGLFLFGVKPSRRKRGVKINATPLMMKRKTVRINPNKFISLAAKRTQSKMPRMYDVEFNKQLKRYVARKKQ